MEGNKFLFDFISISSHDFELCGGRLNEGSKTGNKEVRICDLSNG